MSESFNFSLLARKVSFIRVRRHYQFEGVAMILEHLVYSIAIAIIFGMIYRRITGRDSSWFIVLSAYTLDVDIIADAVLRKIGVTVPVYGAPIDHGDLHNVGVLLVYAVAVLFLLHPLGIRFMDSLIFASVGFALAMHSSWTAISANAF